MKADTIEALQNWANALTGEVQSHLHGINMEMLSRETGRLNDALNMEDETAPEISALNNQILDIISRNTELEHRFDLLLREAERAVRAIPSEADRTMLEQEIAAAKILLARRS